MTTAIYYVNTCDGFTEFEDGTKTEAVANRLVKFPSNLKHRGVSQTDTRFKCVINFNYFTPSKQIGCNNTMKKQFTKTDKKGREETWEWEETPEATKALERLHAEMIEDNSDK